MHKRFLVTCCIVLASTACGGNTRRELTRYDLGVPPAVADGAAVAIVGDLDIGAAPWLAGTDMHYRLSTEPQRRRNYADARWLAPPAELLAMSLRRQTGIGRAGSGACRLSLTLDELEQRFDTDGRSRMHVGIALRLMPARGDTVLARKAMLLAEDVAPDSQDAAGGAAALARASGELANRITDWLRASGVDAAACRRL